MKKWKVWEAMKERVEQFRQTMPLIQDLKNPALRPRHWDALRSEVRDSTGQHGRPIRGLRNTEITVAVFFHAQDTKNTHLYTQVEV